MGAVKRPEPFAEIAPLLSAARTAPLPPLFFVTGDDEWIVAETVRRMGAAFREAFREGEVTSYESAGAGVAEAVADAATIALFSTNRLVTLEASELLRGKGLTADDLDALLDEAADAGDDDRATLRLARRARALANAAGVPAVDVKDDPADAARRVAGRVKRADRAGALAALLGLPGAEDEGAESALDRLLDFARRATSSDNVLLVHAVSPDPQNPGVQFLRRTARAADLAVANEESRAARLHAIGLERAIDRKVLVESEVFDLLTSHGRLQARAFLSDLDRLIDSATGPRVTAEHAARQIADESREYGSDFVDAVAGRDMKEALRLLGKLLSGATFAAFRPWGGKEEAPQAAARKGPRGDAAFFPLLGLLAGEVRRMLALRAALEERGASLRRADYRSFADRILPALRTPRPGLPPLPLDGHPFVLHKAYLACLNWTADELVDALVGIEAIDRGVKTGAGSGGDLLEAWLLSRTRPAERRAAG
jgi:DNA polymerase III delta subunit